MNSQKLFYKSKIKPKYLKEVDLNALIRLRRSVSDTNLAAQRQNFIKSNNDYEQKFGGDTNKAISASHTPPYRDLYPVPNEQETTIPQRIRALGMMPYNREYRLRSPRSQIKYPREGDKQMYSPMYPFQGNSDRPGVYLRRINVNDRNAIGRFVANTYKRDNYVTYEPDSESDTPLGTSLPTMNNSEATSGGLMTPISSSSSPRGTKRTRPTHYNFNYEYDIPRTRRRAIRNIDQYTEEP